jgi:hypothetical protein
MQPVVSKHISLTILFLGLIAPNALLHAGDKANNTETTHKITSFNDIAWTKTGYLTAGLIFGALYIYANLKMKKTQPKRVYPQDDSIEELIKYIHDELLIGQQSYCRELSGEHLDPEDPNHVIYEYSKIEPRGLGGIAEDNLKKWIMPTIALAVAYSVLKKDIQNNWLEIINWIADPTTIFALPKPAAPTTNNGSGNGSGSTPKVQACF